MESLFSPRPRSGADALLVQLTAERASPLEALGRIAAFHTGWSSGVRPFRSAFVGAGAQHFPAPQHVEPLAALLLSRAGTLLSQTRGPKDDLYVAAFLLWGLTAIHPFEDGNGRTALDWVQQALMRRWSADAPLFERRARLDRVLQPVLATLDLANDGSAKGHLAQLAALAARIDTATLASLEADPHFTVIAQVLAASLQTNEELRS
jgi:hypothetical protein